MKPSPYKYSTLAVHAGQQPDPLTGAVNVPVYLSSTFQLTGIGTDRGWDYSRAGNPTRDRLEEALAALEGGMSGHAFTSGMAAISALVAMLRAGDHLICSKDVYAGTVRLFDQIVSGYGIEIEYVDTSNLKAVEAAIRPTTKLIHIETPSNPLMVLTDIAAVSRIAHAHGIEVSVDNTFLSPVLQSPLAGRGHRDAFDHQVPQRALGRAGRSADRLHAGAQGALFVGAEGGGRGDVAV
jgi:cystathionine beta-lyase/cystathionine gamma-synthase